MDCLTNFNSHDRDEAVVDEDSLAGLQDFGDVFVVVDVAAFIGVVAATAVVDVVSEVFVVILGYLFLCDRQGS